MFSEDPVGFANSNDILELDVEIWILFLQYLEEGDHGRIVPRFDGAQKQDSCHLFLDRRSQSILVFVPQPGQQFAGFSPVLGIPVHPSTVIDLIGGRTVLVFTVATTSENRELRFLSETDPRWLGNTADDRWRNSILSRHSAHQGIGDIEVISGSGPYLQQVAVELVRINSSFQAPLDHAHSRRNNQVELQGLRVGEGFTGLVSDLQHHLGATAERQLSHRIAPQFLSLLGDGESDAYRLPFLARSRSKVSSGTGSEGVLGHCRITGGATGEKSRPVRLARSS